MGQEEPRGAAERNRDHAADAADHPAVGPAEPEGTVVGPITPPVASVQGAPPTRRGARAVREVAETVVLALLIFAAVRLVVANFRVDGESMWPNLRDDQLLLVNVNAYAIDLNRVLNLLPGVEREGARVVHAFGPPERGDVVVFDPPVDSDKPYIKRVIGLPGEEVTIAGGAVSIDGVRLDEAYLADPDTGTAVRTPCDRGEVCRITVEEGQVFVLGDNRPYSSDSREFGTVDIDAIVGKAWVSYWPVGGIRPAPHEDYADMPEQAASPWDRRRREPLHRPGGRTRAAGAGRRSRRSAPSAAPSSTGTTCRRGFERRSTCDCPASWVLVPPVRC